MTQKLLGPSARTVDFARPDVDREMSAQANSTLIGTRECNSTPVLEAHFVHTLDCVSGRRPRETRVGNVLGE